MSNNNDNFKYYIQGRKEILVYSEQDYLKTTVYYYLSEENCDLEYL